MSRKKIIEDQINRLGITHNKVAEYSGLSKQDFSKWMYSIIDLPPVHIHKICDLLNLDFNEVLKVK